MRRVTPITVLAATAILLNVSAVSHGQEFQFPESWEGVWETTFTEYDCSTEQVTDQGVNLDTICGGDLFIPEFGEEVAMECTGDVTDAGANLVCSYSEEVFPGCTVTFQYTTEASRSADTVTGTATASITYAGTCFIDDMCWNEEFTSVRLVDEDPGCTSTPVTAQSWGVLKDHYR